MNVPDILEPANEAEAEMARVAHDCLVAALDHSKAQHIEITLDLSEDGDKSHIPPVLKLPPRALHFFADMLRQMAKREPVVLVPQKHELTTQEAANFLNVSRPYVIKEIAAGRLNCRKIGLHRRIEFQELMRYQEEQKKSSEKALEDLAKMSQDIGMEF